MKAKRNIIQPSIKVQVEALAKMPRATDYQFIAKHGRVFAAAALPKRIARAKPGHCFMNAYQLADASGLDYVEGYGFAGDLCFPLEHAWCARADGTVVDPTWDAPEKCQYYGVVIPIELLRRELMKLGHYGVLHTFRGPNKRLMNAMERRAKQGGKVSP